MITFSKYLLFFIETKYEYLWNKNARNIEKFVYAYKYLGKRVPFCHMNQWSKSALIFQTDIYII